MQGDMWRGNFSVSDKVGILELVAAGGAIGVIIPPSIPMVIFGFLTNVSIAELFAGGMLVGVLFGLSFMGVTIWKARRHGYGTRRRFSLRFVATSLRDRKSV